MVGMAGRSLRFLIITFLLGIELAVVAAHADQSSRSPVRYLDRALVHTGGLLFDLDTVWQDTRLQSRVQVLCDLGMATALVYVTGGIDTPFNCLYPLVMIVGSAMLLPRSWAYLTAGLSFIVFGAFLNSRITA